MRSKKAIYNIGTTLMTQIIIILYGFVVPKIIIENFGSDVNGLVTSITQFLSYISLLESGIGPVVKAVLYKPIAKKDKKNIENILRVSEKFFKTISAIFIIYVIVLSVIYPILVSNEFESIYTLSLIIIISISTFAEYYFGITYRLYLQAEQKSYITSIVQSITYILSIIVIIILVKFNFSIQTIKLISGIIFILRPMAQNIYVKKKYKINLKNGDKNYKLEQKWNGLAQHIAAVIHNNTDVTVLTIFSTLAEVSVYSVYYLVIRGIKCIVQAFNDGIDASFGDMIAKKENQNLNNKFKLYEIIYNMIITIFFVCAMILITPFVKIYTRGVNDINYIRPLFGYLIVLSEFIWAIRQPYNNLVKSAGHFKETQKGAWVESITNIIISVILVIKYGIIGVAIGTLTAMLIRTIEFIYHANKYILKRSNKESIKKIIIIVIVCIPTLIVSQFLPNIEINTFGIWIICATIVFTITSIITLTINLLAFKNDFKEILKIFKNLFRKKVKP